MTAGNPRFPHYVKVYRNKTDEDGNPWVNPNTGEEEQELVYESECGLRDLVRGKDVDANILKSDFKLAMPYKENEKAPIILVMDLIEFTHSYTGQVVRGEVEDFKVWNPMFGMNIWFQSNMNKHGKGNL